MKYLPFVFSLFLLCCKAGNNQNVQKVTKPIVAPTSVNPDECQLEADVLDCESSSCLIVVRKILEKGSAFNAEVYSGDTITVDGLNYSKEPVVLTVESLPSMGGSTLTVKKQTTKK